MPEELTTWKLIKWSQALLPPAHEGVTASFWCQPRGMVEGHKPTLWASTGQVAWCRLLLSWARVEVRGCRLLLWNRMTLTLRPTWEATKHLTLLLCSPSLPPSPLPGSRATHSFVIGLLLLELLHHDAPLLVLAPLVLKPDPDHAGAEACHLHQLLFHERVWPGVGGIAGPQGVQLLLVQHSPNTGGLLRLLVDVGPQGRLPGRDGLGCEARGTVR